MGYHTTSEGAARDVHPFPSAAVRVGTRWQVKKALPKKGEKQNTTKHNPKAGTNEEGRSKSLREEEEKPCTRCGCSKQETR